MNGDQDIASEVEERVSGDSRKYTPYQIEQNIVIKSTLDYAELQKYTDLIVQHTRNNKDVFLTLNKDDLIALGITDEQECKKILDGIEIFGKRSVKHKTFNLSEKEALQICDNVYDSLKNIRLGLYLSMDKIIEKPPQNKFVSDVSSKTAAEDALEMIQSTKFVYKNLVDHFYQEGTLSDKDYKKIINALEKSPKSKSKKKFRKILALSITLGSALFISYAIYSKVKTLR